MIAQDQLLPFFRTILPQLTRRRLILEEGGDLEVGDDGEVRLSLPLLSRPLRCQVRVVAREGAQALCVIVGWHPGDEDTLWGLVGLSWQFAQALGHPAFQEAAPPKQARALDLMKLLGARGPGPDHPETDHPQDGEDDADIGIYRMTRVKPEASHGDGREAPAPTPPRDTLPLAPPGPAPASAAGIPLAPPAPASASAAGIPLAPGAPPSPAPSPPPASITAPLPPAPAPPEPQRLNLRRRGLPLVLADLLTEGETGWLEVSVGQTQHRIRLESGEVIQIVQTPGPDERILRIAAHRVDLEWPQLAPHMKAMSKAKVPESVLLKEWVISPSQASRLLRQRVLLQMTGLLPLGWLGDATFTPGDALKDPLLGEAPVLGIPLPRLIWAALRARAQSLPQERLERLSARVQDRSPRWNEGHPFPLVEIRTSPEEEVFIEAFQADPARPPKSLADLPTGQHRAQVVFWCLARLGYIQVQGR